MRPLQNWDQGPWPIRLLSELVTVNWTIGNNNNAGEQCIPFVSVYTDCTEENQCEGCKRCACNANSEWMCEDVKECNNENIHPEADLDDQAVEDALDTMLFDLKAKETEEQFKSNTPLVPKPPSADEERELDEREVLLEAKEKNFEDEILALMTGREKRSVSVHDDGSNDNGTVKFYHTKDELNEDTLKIHNTTGTLTAKKFDPKLISRRTNLSHNESSSALQIEYIQPKIYKHHITDNKIDTPQEEKIDSFVQHKLTDMVGNYSMNEKNQNVSQVVVSELSVGDEVIGDKSAPIISNITFQQQNETITAMALIAGNLLNKLWNMEKDSNGDAIDIEMLRHEKISDLIELFKEPFNLRQQLFLKNALEQLSSAIEKNKDVQSIALCENVEKVKKAEAARLNKDCNKRKSNKSINVTETDAANKITKVLDMIKQYEQVQKKIDILTVAAPKANVKNFITKDEQLFLNTYGTVLNTITKLLLPKHHGKTVKKAIRNSNSLTKEDVVKQKLKDLYNIDLGNMSVTAKDKIVLDYLTHIQSRPNCLLKKQKNFILPDVNGDVLLNLSDFFKIKSVPDLLKLFGIENHPLLRDNERVTTVQTSTAIETSTSVTTTNIYEIHSVSTNSVFKKNKSKFESTKEKLKDHLKTILEDIVELQNIERKLGNGKNIKIADALPCIYNLLEDSKDRVNDESTVSNKKDTLKSIQTEKVQEIFDNLKQDLKSEKKQTRRTNSILNTHRPKSVVVWERVIKNIERKKTKTRRTMSGIPKSLEEIKKSITNLVSNRSNSYNNYAYLYEVPAADRYLLLKTFQTEVNKYINTLRDIKITVDSKPVLGIEASEVFKKFVDNAAETLNLNEKIVRNLDKPKKIEPKMNSSVMNKNLKLKRPRVRPLELSDNRSLNKNEDVKLTREQIILQLIKHRVQNYLKTKNNMQTDVENDIRYNIANKILTNLETGNYELAKELYKIFASSKHRDIGSNNRVDTSTLYSDSTQILNRGQIRKEPLIQFEDTIRKDSINNQDQVIKQLLNLRRKMKI